MKCAKHPNVDSVGQCSSCGAGICNECYEISESLRSNCGPLCFECYETEVEHMKEHFGNSVSQKKKRLLSMIGWYIFGIVLLLVVGVFGDGGLYAIVAGVGFASWEFARMGWTRGEEAHAEEEEKHGVTYTVTENKIERNDGFFMKLLYAALYAVVGLIGTPIFCIKLFLDRKEDMEYYEMMSAELNRLRGLE